MIRGLLFRLRVGCSVIMDCKVHLELDFAENDQNWGFFFSQIFPRYHVYRS